MNSAAAADGSIAGLAALASALVLLLNPAPAGAQVLLGYLFGERLATPTFNMGFEVGANFSSFDSPSEAQRTTRPVFGLFGDWRFSENFHLTGAVLPFAGRGARGLAPLATGDPGLDAQTGGGTMERSLDYVEIPLLLKWTPQREEGFRVGAGPSFAIVTGARDRYQCVTASGRGYVLERDVKGELPAMDFGLSFDAEWRFPMLSIAARYTDGLTNMGAGFGSPVHTRALTGTGRIYLGKKPAP